MHEELTLKADVAIVRLRCDNRFVEKVKRGISETLQSGPLTLGQVAKKLNVSERTLQRRLKEKNVRFNDVLDLTRQQSAKEYLLNTSVPLVDVASQLGFANSASFNRAFKRWFSETPNRFRYARHNVFQESLAIDGS
jgi:AraC-like DNA-binding protein